MVLFVRRLEFLFNDSKITTKSQALFLELNEAKIIDSIWKTPFNSDSDQIKTKFLISNTPVDSGFMNFKQSA